MQYAILQYNSHFFCCLKNTSYLCRHKYDRDMARKDVWTREQLIMALNVYFKLPFKDVKEKHPLIQKYADFTGFVKL